MKRAWDPDREITIEEALDAIRSMTYAGPLTSAAIVAAGWDNSVVVVDDDWLFRFPRREIALPGIQREIDWLPRLAPALSLPIPVPEHVGTCGDPAWPFWGARRLVGEELTRATVSAQVATLIGSFLAELHDQPRNDHIPVDPFGRADAAARSMRAREVLGDLRELGLWHGDPGIDAVLKAGSELGPPSAMPVVSHGDLYSRHVLVDGDRLSIIDWGDLCMASPAIDLAIAYSAFDGESRTALLAAYGHVDDETLLRAQTFAVFSAASVVHYAHDIGDSAMVAEFTAQLATVS